VGTRNFSTAVFTEVDRSVPPMTAAEVARPLEQAGIDYFATYDQLSSWWPPSLWNTGTTPLAALSTDCDSFSDAFIIAALAAGATEELGVLITSDCVRRGPAELMQTMLTLGNLTKGKAIVALGSGEAKQIKPFGHQRLQGTKRLEDTLRIARLLGECNGPVSYEGRVWRLQDAFIGGQRPYKPEFWCLGAGPQLLELATAHADGFMAAAPFTFPSAEQFHERVSWIRTTLESRDRDPGEFGVGMICVALLHEDRRAIEECFRNPLVKFMSGVFGRFHQGDWSVEGIEPVMPADWHYAFKLLPLQMPKDEIDRIVEAVPERMVERSFFCGTPEQVTEQIQLFVDAGANHVIIADMLPVVHGPDQAGPSFGRMLQVAGALKARNLLTQP